jgi:hypothetical protein
MYKSLINPFANSNPVYNHSRLYDIVVPFFTTGFVLKVFLQSLSVHIYPNMSPFFFPPYFQVCKRNWNILAFSPFTASKLIELMRLDVLGLHLSSLIWCQGACSSQSFLWDTCDTDTIPWQWARAGFVCSIMYPLPVDLKFERDSYKFVELLACVTSIGFLCTVITKVGCWLFGWVDM